MIKITVRTLTSEISVSRFKSGFDESRWTEEVVREVQRFSPPLCLLSLLLLFSVQRYDKLLGADLHLASVFMLFVFDCESAPLQGQDKCTALTCLTSQISASCPLPLTPPELFGLHCKHFF